MFSAVSAALLCVWYLLSVTGIDIHSDHEHGQTYVVSGLTGCDCEHIHPGHHCHDTAAEGLCAEGEDCCSDDFEAVLAPGEDADEGIDLSAPVSAAPVFAAFVPAMPVSGAPSGVRCDGPPPPGPSPAFIACCVLRI